MDMPQASAAADRRAALRGQVIVVLEDDDLVRRATERLLRRCGAEVVAARSSGEALASLAARRLAPWCIVADYWLSHEESGLAAVAALRTAALQTAAATPPHAVIVTGDFSRELAEAVAGAGCGLLRKPVEVDDFLDALCRFT
ncbi:MAG TPA: response regulator [Kiloniellaceae bacterium]